MATPTHAGRARLCRAHVYHPPALPGAAEPSRRPHTTALLCGRPSAGSSTAPAAPRRGTAPAPPCALAQDRTGAAARYAGREPLPVGATIAVRRRRVTLGLGTGPAP